MLVSDNYTSTYDGTADNYTRSYYNPRTHYHTVPCTMRNMPISSVWLRYRSRGPVMSPRCRV